MGSAKPIHFTCVDIVWGFVCLFVVCIWSRSVMTLNSSFDCTVLLNVLFKRKSIIPYVYFNIQRTSLKGPPPDSTNHFSLPPLSVLIDPHIIPSPFSSTSLPCFHKILHKCSPMALLETYEPFWEEGSTWSNFILCVLFALDI